MIVVVIIGAAAAGIFLSTPSHSSTTTSSSVTTQSSTAGSPFVMNYVALDVGYNGGLFEIAFQDVGGKPVESVVVSLATPKPAALCTGSGYGLQFANCIPAANGKGYAAIPTSPQGFPANTTFSGFATGIGPGSAIVGQNYTVVITSTYTDGTLGNDTLSVTATSGGG